MSKPTYFNQRHEGVPGGINVQLMTKQQETLMRHLMLRARSDPRSVVMLAIRHMTVAEQDELLRVYEL